MNPPGIRPETIAKYEKAMKLKKDNPDLEIQAICKRVGISQAWFRGMRKKLKEKGTT